MIKFQSLPRQKRQAIREEVLRMYAETDMSYVEIAEVNGVQLRTVEYIIRNFPLKRYFIVRGNISHEQTRTETKGHKLLFRQSS